MHATEQTYMNYNGEHHRMHREDSEYAPKELLPQVLPADPWLVLETHGKQIATTIVYLAPPPLQCGKMLTVSVEV